MNENHPYVKIASTGLRDYTGIYCLMMSILAVSSTLKMMAICCFETSVEFQRTKQWYILKARAPHTWNNIA
jgi:hypothetical protein